MEKRLDLKGWAFLPFIVFLILYVGSGLLFTYWKVPQPFDQFSRFSALLFAISVGLFMAPSIPLSKKADVFSNHAGASGVMMIVLIYLLAGAFQSTTQFIGGKQSLVNLGLTYIPDVLLVPGIFLLSCGISTAIGTSMGTIAAIGPVAASVAQGAGLSLPMTCAAVIGGAYFGDNLSLISDTTISATQGVGAKMKDKFQANFLLALPAAIIACFLFSLFGRSATIQEIGSFDVILILPYLIVFVTALCGVNVILVLLIGIFSTVVIGVFYVGVDIMMWIEAISTGMEQVFSISMVAILISGIIGLIRFYGGVEWLIQISLSKVKKQKHAEYGIGFLSGLLSAALMNNTLAIMICAPIAKDIGKTYQIEPKRLASILDIFACVCLSILPHDGGVLMMSSFTGIAPTEILPYSFYSFALFIITCLSIQFPRTKYSFAYNKNKTCE